jgi:PPM family protein phosphatase
MFCKNCKLDVGDVDFCSSCGYDFLSNNDTSDKQEELSLKLEVNESMRWDETIRMKPVRTGLIYVENNNLLLAKEATEILTKKYSRLRQFASEFLPDENQNEAEKSYIVFEWNSTWLKLSEWLKTNPPFDQRVRIWNHIAGFVHRCHENGLIVNQFHPNCIWIDIEQLKPVFEAFEFISYPNDKEIIIYNEGFSSPEVREGNWSEVSFPSDIYCLGKLLFFLLNPENNETGARDFAPGIDSFIGLNLLSKRLGFGIGKCLRNQPLQRFRSVADLFKYLQKSELEPVNITGFSHVGFRALNEDAIYYSNRRIRCLDYFYDTTIAVLADGMGGLDKGEVASNTVIKMISHELEQKINELVLYSGTQALNFDEEVIFGHIHDAIEQCNMAMVTQAADSASQMGSTVVVAVLINHYLYMGYVGDSRLYIFDEANQITFVSEDHSLVGKREAIGDITEEEALTHPNKNVLYQAIGLKEAIRIDKYRTKLKPGQKIMLCSDGISGSFLKKELTAIFGAHPNITVLGDVLFFEALERNSLDNCSLILAEIVKGSNHDEYQFELVAAEGECTAGDGIIPELLPAGSSEPGSAAQDEGEH